MTLVKKIWDHFEEYTVITMIAVSAVLIFAQVIMRYVFNDALTWSEELVRYLYVWEVWLGIAYATKRRSQLRITVLRDRLDSGKLPFKLVEIIVMIIWFSFGVFLIVVGTDMCIRVGMLRQRSAALRLPMQYVYMCIPLGALLMNIRMLKIFSECLAALFKKGKSQYE